MPCSLTEDAGIFGGAGVGFYSSGFGRSAFHDRREGIIEEKEKEFPPQNGPDGRHPKP